MNPTLTSVELFSGAGGLALGVAAAGFEHALLLEYNQNACNTLKANRVSFGPKCEIHQVDVREFDFAGFAGIDLLAAGAPCQPFSIGGKHRAHRDDRNLFPEVFRAVRELRPRAVLVENVKGLLRESLAEFVEFIELRLAYPSVALAKNSDQDDWPEQLRVLREVRRKDSSRTQQQYEVHRVLLNAADFGVPQKRERVFFVALRRDVEGEWKPPVPTHSEAALLISQHITGEYWRRHGID
ncbi:MAG TPA: DNA cytosine methyltransferase, partial [Gemmatimonadaceae bacterium]